jgi:hypothetical protein
MAPHMQLRWPPLSEAYLDEFGPIAEDVYRCAGELWPRAEAFSVSTLRDGPAGLSLLLNASALVTRARSERHTRIDNLPAYLFTTFKRLVLARLEVENGHRRLEEGRLFAPTPEGPADPDEKILLQQIIRRMDAPTREVFELLLLGYTFEEIADNYGRGANALRATYSRQVRRLVSRVTSEHKDAAEKTSWYRRLRGR